MTYWLPIPGGVDVTENELKEYAHYGRDWSTGETLAVRGHGNLANAWGLELMAGNVLKWCSDWNNKYPAGDVTDPVGLNFKEGSFRVFLGGCWRHVAALCASGCRRSNDPSHRSSFSGFRLVLSPSGIDELMLKAKSK